MWNPFGGGASPGRLSLGMEDEGALTVTVTVAVLAVTAAWLAWRRLRRGRLPPGPRAWPIVGNLMQMQNLAQGVRCRGFWEWSQVYGPIMSVWMGNSLNVVVSSPELAKQVLKEHDQPLANRHRNRPTLRFSRNGQDLIWADYGPHYVKVRKVCTLELFTPKRLEALRPLREDEVSAMVLSLSRDVSREPGVPLLVRKYLSAVTFNNITRIVFGKRFMDDEGNFDPQGLEFKEIVSNGVNLGATANMAEHISYLRWMFPLQEEVFVKHNQRRDRLTKTIMEEYRAAHQNNKQQHFVDALLTLQHQYSLSDDTVFGLLWDMITAGMDTTAITAEWAMAELVRNPEVQARAQEELDRVVGRDRNLTEADFGQLPYLSCIVKEALRLHPPTPLMLPHKAAQAVRLGGYHVPRGANVHVNVWAIGRDPGVWRDPLAFRPERFLEEDVDMKGHDFRLLPFGAGRRICPGAQLGIFLLQSMVGHLLHAFQWAPPPGSSDVDLAEAPGLVTFMATPVRAVASPRLPHQHLYQRLPTATM